MADLSHAEDTVFFVAEGDFRFYREDAMKEASIVDEACTLNRVGRVLDLMEAGTGGVWSLLERPGAAGEPVAPAGSGSSGSAGEPVAPAAAASSQGAAAARSVVGPAEDVFAYASPSKPGPEEFEDVSPELVDLLCYMSKAESVGRGNLVWFGWNASPTGSNSPRRAQSIANGSQLIAITAKGARWLQPRLEAPPACVVAVRRGRSEGPSSPRAPRPERGVW